MDWTFITCGALAEHLLTSADHGVDLASRVVRVAEQGLDTAVVVTALKDVGELVAMALVDSATRGKQLHIGRSTTRRQVVDTLRRHKADDKEWTVEQLSNEQLQEMADSEPKRVFPKMALSMMKGSKVTVWDGAQTWKNGEHRYTDLEAVAAQVLPEPTKEQVKK